MTEIMHTKNMDELRVVLTGKTGSGISSTGNLILKAAVFVTSLFSVSTTLTSSCEETIRDGRKIIVVDTPGLFHTSKKRHDVKDEIMKCLKLVPPGPHAFLYILRISKYSEEEDKTIEELTDMFGDSVLKFTVVIITCGEFLEDTEVWKFINGTPKLKSFVERCDRRIITISKHVDDKEKDRIFSELLSIITHMRHKNRIDFYSQAMFNQHNAFVNKILFKPFRNFYKTYISDKQTGLKILSTLKNQRVCKYVLPLIFIGFILFFSFLKD